MSDANQILTYSIIGAIVVFAVLREMAATCLPASHWINQVLHSKDGGSGGSGDGGFWDCDGDGGD
ncbi:hypothetical protein [uncultured Tateyamaria sp.]|uniref:hypothetical protein n=1 Tax=uncultured Tateyamaria sp. TaxID=455651 RepID=UPI00261E425F|nr:hypothetical protein [uncultured Tateyamaria sp.]